MRLTAPPSPSGDARRRFLLTCAAVAAAGSAACASDTGDRALSLTSLAQAQAELMRLASAPQRSSAAVWSWAQTLVHCAQSIEYSMSGYPQPSSRLFQATVGAAAFNVFAWRGRMSHDLSEPIPGAPSLADASDEPQALARLQQALADFAAWSGALRPHFAYGELDKAQYELAHAMHLANHLSLFDVQA